MLTSLNLFLDIKANYLVSPQLVVAFAIAGRIDIDFEKEPLGISSSTNTPVFLRDVWPTKQDVLTLEHRFVVPAIFRQVPTRLAYGTKEWSKIKLLESTTGEEIMAYILINERGLFGKACLSLILHTISFYYRIKVYIEHCSRWLI